MTALLELMAPFEPGTAMACTTAEPDLFFADSPADIEVAKGICATCELQQSCLTAALERREPHGVWGGQLLIGGEVVAQKRPRGRPRKVLEEAPVIAASAAAEQEAA